MSDPAISPLARAAQQQCRQKQCRQTTWELGISYTGELAGNVQDHAVKANFTWSF
jgi:hypothetical protein